ncbi:peptide ABC transporter substrate-binding protein [Marinovum sp.]|uniref:peptide ABC transporter substrate-binding protein n=1 Tax=Marinovum sp. TaxID=2024839 RepID=UPI002B279ECF|nr:peptide ABC transporter substrate-binding protein [Marinovum sp.]
MTARSLLLGATASFAMATGAQAERGSDGEVRILYWQAPSTLNPFLSGGRKDTEAGGIILEPLARFDEEGILTPWLVDEIPTVENGGVSEDLTQITWKLSPGITWSDGTPLTSADVKFTYEYCTHPEGGCAQQSKFNGITSVETPDAQTVVVTFDSPTPNPHVAFVGMESPILQAAQFADCLGAAASSCTEANFAPIGTGPFVVEEFRPNDVIVYAANENYRKPDRPYFAKVTLKGGGDPASAARAVMETGEFDYAWNQQLAPDIIESLEAGGKGVFISDFGPTMERLMLNHTNPDPSLGPDERAIIKPHPFLQNPAVYKAMSMAIDRQLLVEVGYGPAGKVTCNWVPAPEWYNSDTFDCAEQDLEGANALLDEAGIIDTDGDGIREKDGVPLKVLFQTSTNAVRQDSQELIKQMWSDIGIETELRNINASVFFGGDAGSPDTFQRFYADVQMYANTFGGTDPQGYFGNGLCDKAPTPEKQWQGENIARYCNPAFDALHEELTRTVGNEARGEIGRQLNDMAIEEGMMIPLVHRGTVAARANTLEGVVMNAWDSELWNIDAWRRAD